MKDLRPAPLHKLIAARKARSLKVAQIKRAIQIVRISTDKMGYVYVETQQNSVPFCCD